jgi:hypothetical protein
MNTPLPIADENKLVGDDRWDTPSDESGIAGFADQASVERGGSVNLYVSTSSPTYSLDVFRLGWYQGLGARQLLHKPDLLGHDQGSWVPGTFGIRNCPACVADAKTGLVVASWTASYQLPISATWASGNYVVRLTSATGKHAWVYFVVRDDTHKGGVLALMPINTMEAYNGWGGKSLYPYNSVGLPVLPGRLEAVKVSFDRPFQDLGPDRADLNTISFLEQR